MIGQKNLKLWAAIYRGLGNQNRLRILQLLHAGSEMSVTELADELGISFKNTSRNLKILHDLGLLEFEGKKDKVYYSLNSYLDHNMRKILQASIIKFEH